jgi:putative oxidoreductase
MSPGRLILRVAIGGFFIGHGTQKLYGWFGGSGLEGTGQGFAAMGLAPGRRNAAVAGAAEAGGGSLLVLGLATPLAAGALISVMVTAIRTVHLKNGPWNTNGGYEYPVVMIAALLALAEAGPGDLSLDASLGIARQGVSWLAAALALGVAGSLAATELAKRNAEEPIVEEPRPAESL